MLTSEPSLKGYHLLPSVRGDLLAKLGRFDEARAEFERAASLTRNARERQVLLGRAAECASAAAGPPAAQHTADAAPDAQTRRPTTDRGGRRRWASRRGERPCSGAPGPVELAASHRQWL